MILAQLFGSLGNERVLALTCLYCLTTRSIRITVTKMKRLRAKGCLVRLLHRYCSPLLYAQPTTYPKFCEALDLLRLPPQPLRRPLILLKNPASLLPDLLMIVIQPFLLVHRKQRCVYQLPAHWDHGHMFKREPWFVSKVVFC